MPRPSLRSVAKIAGFSHETVSLALKNHPSIPQKTRKAIQKTAQQMGYSPNPLYSQLMREVRSGTTHLRATFAILNLSPRSAWRYNPLNKLRFRYCKHACKQLGYALDHFWAKEWLNEPSKFFKTLHHRNIEGIIIIGSQYHQEIRDWDFSKISVVNLSDELRQPQFNRIRSDYIEAVNLTLSTLQAQGYTRPLAMFKNILEDQFLDIQNAFRGYEQKKPFSKTIPYIQTPQAFNEKAFKSLIKEHEPDILILNSDTALNHTVAWNAQNDTQLPFCLFDKIPFYGPHQKHKGIHHNYKIVALKSIQTLAMQTQNKEFGIPSIPTTTLVKPTI